MLQYVLTHDFVKNHVIIVEFVVFIGYRDFNEYFYYCNFFGLLKVVPFHSVCETSTKIQFLRGN